MMTRVALLLFSVFLLSLGAREASAQPITQSGPNSAFGARTMIVPINDTDIVTASITTSKSNRILVIEGSVTDNQAGGSASLYAIRPVINGNVYADLRPTGTGYANLQVSSATVHANTMTMVWWLDLNAAGLGSTPLSITMQGSAFPAASTANISFVAYTLAK